MADRMDDRSLGDLFAELSRETSQLVRKEMQLATAEMTAKAKTGAAQAGMDFEEVVAGGLLLRHRLTGRLRRGDGVAVERRP